MPQKALFKRLTFAYGSAATVIGIFIVLAQVVIQLSLYNEISTRNLASTMSLQELHSQRLLRNALMTLVKPQDEATINPLRINPVQQIQQDLSFLETTNKSLLSGNTPSAIITRVQTAQPDFRIIDAAGHQIIVDIQRHNVKDQSKQVVLIFVHEQAYLAGVYAAFVILTQEADDYVERVQFSEISICLISLGVITFEAFGIVIPAIHDYKKALDELGKAVGEKREALKAKKETQQ
jgi:hypothetical protein